MKIIFRDPKTNLDQKNLYTNYFSLLSFRRNSHIDNINFGALIFYKSYSEKYRTECHIRHLATNPMKTWVLPHFSSLEYGLIMSTGHAAFS
jgi:hypothetical protein